MHHHQDVGPTLKSLRRAKGLTQEEVAVRLGRKAQSISRLEQPGSNPKAETLLKYLGAIGADFEDFNRALNDPLAREVRKDDERLPTEPPYRELVRGMLSYLGGPEPVPELKAILDRIEDHDRRLKELEGQALQDDEPGANGDDED